MVQPLAVLLDFGGTLDSEGLHWSTQFALAFDAAQAVVTRDALDRAFLEADRELEGLADIAAIGLRGHVEEQARRMTRLLGLSDPALAGRVAERFLARAGAHLRRNLGLLALYRDRVQFGLVSNFTPNLDRILEETGLAGVLDTVVCSARVGLRKPDPAIFRLALANLGVEPAEAVMIGDSLVSDIMPARSLGLTTIWIRGDRVFGRGDERAADHVAPDFAHALALCISGELDHPVLFSASAKPEGWQ